jgi:hypothetical protein
LREVDGKSGWLVAVMKSSSNLPKNLIFAQSSPITEKNAEK